MNLTEKEKIIFDLITSQGGGVTLLEINKKTGLEFATIKQIAQKFSLNGVPVTTLSVGGGNYRYLYSPYAVDYEERIKK